jgi:hypothetical protein
MGVWQGLPMDSLEQVCPTFCLPRARFLFSNHWVSTNLNIELYCIVLTALYLLCCTYCTVLAVLYLLYLLYLFVFSTWFYSKCCSIQGKTRCQICLFWAKVWRAITPKLFVRLSWIFLCKCILTSFIWDWDILGINQSQWPIGYWRRLVSWEVWVHTTGNIPRL